MKKRVFVGLSGGVDSSVSAALLKKDGYDVTGVFIKVWQPDFMDCNSKEDRLDAMRVAAHLGIPFRTLHLEKEYKKEVVDYMIAEYQKGNTPNPDAMCNKEIKFGAFLKYARKEGANYVATGHYARNVFDKKTKKYKLLKGLDENKDQSYFLWTLGQGELSKIIFPVGEYKKEKVRTLAEKFGLITAAKKDSQGLCFVGKVDMKKFLKHFIKEKGGDVINTDGKVIGKHDGATFYTLGERHGFTITKKSPSDCPYYVMDKNIRGNTITVSHERVLPRDESMAARVVAKKINFTGGTPRAGENLSVRFRYREKLIPCRIVSVKGGSIEIAPLDKQFIAPAGQSLVLYRKNECVGGGIIS
ncbi:MAG: tRNA 2-thiouridine(34) synthase MnmA [Patescibacteria group bacterium]